MRAGYRRIRGGAVEAPPSALVAALVTIGGQALAGSWADARDRPLAPAPDATGRVCGIRLDHTLWCWGLNRQGQLGLGDQLTRKSPSQVGSDADWSLVRLGGHSFAIRLDQTLWRRGANHYGQLGVGDTGRHRIPTRVGADSDWTSVRVGSYHTCAIRQQRTLWCWGYNDHGLLGLGDHGLRLVPTRV